MVSGGEPVSGELESMASVECRGGRERERERERPHDLGTQMARCPLSPITTTIG